MLNWIRNVNLLWLFVLLFAFHGILYYTLENNDWFTLALLATVVDTAVVAVVQWVVSDRAKQR
ncbi:hypothetical protein SY83_20160 [Paenibacillus swuensis]|uniref:Uncharacterized protein n=1 Tax=Paenibacillus swuensis TaxID=1178515 RepID=A0A172TMI2_9BACL|nr:hypothetical protein [Paenibacillus swuensis]ANE48220.1 hypothetical protein SY83_20160 [Paenibacillus swuensis]